MQRLRRIITCRAACLITTVSGAVAGGRLEIRPLVESSDLEETVLPLHR